MATHHPRRFSVVAAHSGHATELDEEDEAHRMTNSYAWAKAFFLGAKIVWLNFGQKSSKSFIKIIIFKR